MSQAYKNTICHWYDGDAEAAAAFYAATFPNSSVDSVHRAPGDYPSGSKWQVRAAAKRVFEAMMEMGKIDIAGIEAARNVA